MHRNRLLTLPVTQPITPNGTVVEDVVVHVNDQIISRSDVERAEQQLVAGEQADGGERCGCGRETKESAARHDRQAAAAFPRERAWESTRMPM